MRDKIPAETQRSLFFLVLLIFSATSYAQEALTAATISQCRVLDPENRKVANPGEQIAIARLEIRSHSAGNFRKNPEYGEKKAECPNLNTDDCQEYKNMKLCKKLSGP
jgi:hypothetical protein